MDESKGEEVRADNVPECSASVSTVITCTTTETVTEKTVEEVSGGIEEQQRVRVSGKVVAAEGEDAGACEGGDVMVEVLGSEVLVDGVRRFGGEVCSDELGSDRGDGGGRENPENDDGGDRDADRDCGGKVDSTVLHDVVLSERQGDCASFGVESQASGPGHEVASGNGRSLATNYCVKDSEIHDVVGEKLVKAAIERSSEKKLDGEGGVKAMVSSSSRNMLGLNSGSHNFEARSNQIGNSQCSTSQFMSAAGGNNDLDAQKIVESTKDEGNHHLVVEYSSMPSESMSKEPVILEKGDQRGLSEPQSGTPGDELLDATVNRGIESVEAPSGDERNSCDESVDYSSVELGSSGTDGKVVAEEQVQESSFQSQIVENDTVFETGKEEADVIDSVTRTSGTANTKSSAMQTQLGIKEKNCDADNVNGFHKESDSLASKASVDKGCCSAEDQQFCASTVKFDGNTVTHGVGDQELQPETAVLNVHDEFVVAKEPEALAQVTEMANDSELIVTIRENVVVSRGPQDFTRIPETGDGSKLTAVSAEAPENDGQGQCCSTQQKPVSCSEIEQNLKNEPVVHADMRSLDESSFSCREDTGTRNVEVSLEVKDGEPKSEILRCVKAGIDDASGTADEMKDVEGNSMEIDDVKGSKDHPDNQKVDEKTKLGDVGKNGFHPQLGYTVEGTSVTGMDIDAVDANSEEHGIGFADYRSDSKSNNAMIIENRDSEDIANIDSAREIAPADGNPRSIEAGQDILSSDSSKEQQQQQQHYRVDSTKEVIGKCKPTPNSAAFSNDDPVFFCFTEVMEPASSESKNVIIQVVSMDNTSANEYENNRLPDTVTDPLLGIEAEDEAHKMDVKRNMGLAILETDVPNVSVAGSVIAEVVTVPAPRQDAEGESEGHATHQQPTLPDESLVRCVDEGLKCEPDTSSGKCLKNATDGVTQVDANMEDIQEMQEQAANTDVSITGSLVTNSDACIGLDKNAYEPPPLLDESLVKCVNQLECEIDTSLGECMDRNATDGVDQVGSNAEGILGMQEQAANTDQVASVKVASASDQKATKLLDPVASVVLDKQAMQADEKIHETYEKPSTSIQMQETEVPDVFVAGSSAVDSDTGFNQVETQDCGGCAVHEQLPLPDETLVRGLVQRVECEPDTSLAECVDKRPTDGADVDDVNIKGLQEVQETAASTQEFELPQKQEIDQNPVSDLAKFRNKYEKSARRGPAKPGSSVRDHWVTYELAPEDEGEFSVFDLVWGKVKSHPWWPGQIFHPSDSSEKAMKYYRKDCYLVAYFGDRSFAWNEASVLKPFRKHFSQEEKQSNSESFQNAVNCALAEVSRRVELGLACSCISERAYDKIKYQIVENGGIREESSKREGVDRSTGPDTFQSAKLVEYVKALAITPTSGADRLDLAIAKAQLLALNRLEGCDALAEFQYYNGLTEYDVDVSLPREHGIYAESDIGDSTAGGDGKTRLKNPHKRKHNLKDIVYQRRKGKSLTELVGETMYYLDSEFDSHEEDDVMLCSPTSGSKRKASGYLTDDLTAQRSTKTISFAKVSHTTSSVPQQSFKVGECIRRVASQLTGSLSIIKNASDESNSKLMGDDADEVVDASDVSPTASSQDQSSQDEMLAQLHLSARDPMKGYSFLSDIVSFFSEFRNAAVSAQRQRMRKGSRRKRNPSVAAVGSPKTFEFDDRNDSYWTDMVVQNNSETKPARRGRKRKENQIVAEDPGKPPQSTRRKYSKKQYFHSNHEPVAEMQSGDENKQGHLPTELMLNFVEVISIPSKVNLNKIFRRFGPLRESETEVDMQTSRARVVFKKRSDAEVAYSSAAMFNIFGSMVVNYQLNYTPSVPFGTPSLALIDTTEHPT